MRCNELDTTLGGTCDLFRQVISGAVVMLFYLSSIIFFGLDTTYLRILVLHCVLFPPASHFVTSLQPQSLPMSWSPR